MTLLDVYDDFYPFYCGLFIYDARFLFKNVFKENGNLFYGACDFTKAKHNQARWGDFVTPFKGRLSEVGIRPLIRLLKPSSRGSKTKFTFGKDKSSRYKGMRKVV